MKKTLMGLVVVAVIGVAVVFFVSQIFLIKVISKSKTGTMGEGQRAGEKKTLRIKGVDYTFCWCPAGEFTMGSQETEKDRFDRETPHEVRLSRGFWMLESEVTQEMWESVMGTTIEEQRRKAHQWWQSAGKQMYKDVFGEKTIEGIISICEKLYGAGSRYPMYYVSWEESKKFCEELSKYSGESMRLPSEAEWEYACRAGSMGTYGGSEDLDEMGWYLGNSGDKIHEVKTKRANTWGLYDMHGNVREWCQDWYDYDYYKKSPPTDPTGPESGSGRVSRGGGWRDNAGDCRSANRGGFGPGFRSSSLGFRLAASSAH